jgi:membrane associated rhomboid family serine protease
VLVSVLSFSDLRSVVQNWGLIPAQLWRHGGLTLASSFFLHGGIWHLVGNVYFLLVFGDNVEDYLGRWRWLALLVAASLLGDTMHVLFEPRSTMPCVGASGGISGLIVFYALAFPRARLSFMWRYWLYFRWIGMPAWVALVLWLLLQSWGAYAQFMGFSHVSATAHLGGAGVGFLAWLAWHRTKPLPDGG